MRSRDHKNGKKQVSIYVTLKEWADVRHEAARRRKTQAEFARELIMNGLKKAQKEDVDND